MRKEQNTRNAFPKHARITKHFLDILEERKEDVGKSYDDLAGQLNVHRQNTFRILTGHNGILLGSAMSFCEMLGLDFFMTLKAAERRYQKEQQGIKAELKKAKEESGD